MSGKPISFAKKNIFKGLSDEIKIDLKRKLLYLSGTSSIFIDGKNISGEDIVFDYENNSILNSENLIDFFKKPYFFDIEVQKFSSKIFLSLNVETKSYLFL